MTQTSTTYQAEIEAWRAQMEATLRADDGWLTVVGLFWLAEGPNPVGSAPESVVLLPQDAPAYVGSLYLTGREVTFVPADDSPVQINGAPVHGPTPIRLGKTTSPDQLTLDDLTFFLIPRDERIGVRLRDKRNAARHTFTGRIWFPVDEQYRRDGTFVRYDEPKTLTITSVLGHRSEIRSPGYVQFTLDGQSYTLDVSSESERGLFIVFRDLTAGDETYPAARFLYPALPVGGKVTIDFNRAVSPPCAFTEFATCPLPARQNRLPVRIPAGERYH